MQETRFPRPKRDPEVCDGVLKVCSATTNTLRIVGVTALPLPSRELPVPLPGAGRGRREGKKGGKKGNRIGKNKKEETTWEAASCSLCDPTRGNLLLPTGPCNSEFYVSWADTVELHALVSAMNRVEQFGGCSEQKSCLL